MLRIQAEQIPKTGGAYICVKLPSFMCLYIEVYGIPFVCPQSVYFYLCI